MKIEKSQNDNGSDKGYRNRDVVARMGIIGHVNLGKVQTMIYQFLTLHVPGGHPEAVEFVGVAKTDDNNILLVEQLKEGDIVIPPGFVYRKTFMTGNIMAAHLHAMQTFRPVRRVEYVRDDAPAVDLGVANINPTEE